MSSNPNTTKEVYDKTSDLLTVFQNHIDNGCQHCLSIIKKGLGTNQNPNDAGDHSETNLNVHG